MDDQRKHLVRTGFTEQRGRDRGRPQAASSRGEEQYAAVHGVTGECELPFYVLDVDG